MIPNFLNLGFFKYLTLGFEAFNAVTTLVAMVRVPASLSGPLVWAVVQPVLLEIQMVAGIKINMNLAQQISDQATATLRLALTKGA